MTLKTILFDLDGTLLDTAPDFEKVINQLLEEEQRPLMNSAEVRKTVSNGSKGLIEKAFDCPESDPRFESLRQRLLAFYLDHLAVLTKPFPGIEQLLLELKQRQLSWGIVTNKPSTYALPLMAQMNMQPAPLSIVCPDHVSRAKPDPEPLLLACSQINCAAEEAIYIGDHRRDIEAGQQAGMLTVAAAYGYIDEVDPADQWQADYLVNSAEELLPLIEKHL